MLCVFLSSIARAIRLTNEKTSAFAGNIKAGVCCFLLGGVQPVLG